MSTLTPSEAVPLGAALAMRLAATHRVRALFIKGAALQQQGLRGEHESVDVDIWVAPNDHTRYLGVLAEHGWLPVAQLSAMRLVPHHAVTLHHENWPITLDVHQRFPGFLADSQTVFEVLWQGRTACLCAGVKVPTPAAPAHAAVAALHYLRAPGSGLARISLPDLVGRVRAALDDVGLSELARVASATGAAEELSTFLAAVGAPPPGPIARRDAAATLVWRQYQHDVAGANWLRTILAARWHRRPVLLWRISALASADIDQLRGPDESRAAARWRRLRSMTRIVPTAVRQVWRERTRGEERP